MLRMAGGPRDRQGGGRGRRGGGGDGRRDRRQGVDEEAGRVRLRRLLPLAHGRGRREEGASALEPCGVPGRQDVDDGGGVPQGHGGGSEEGQAGDGARSDDGPQMRRGVRPDAGRREGREGGRQRERPRPGGEGRGPRDDRVGPEGAGGVHGREADGDGRAARLPQGRGARVPWPVRGDPEGREAGGRGDVPPHPPEALRHDAGGRRGPFGDDLPDDEARDRGDHHALLSEGRPQADEGGVDEGRRGAGGAPRTGDKYDDADYGSAEWWQGLRSPI